MKICTESISRVCHEANRAYCVVIGDESQKSWDEAEEWQKEGMRDGVLFLFKNPSVGPEASHNNWLEKKKMDGWKYGPVKDAVKKEHPCCVPYEELPNGNREKDVLLTNIVRTLQKFDI